MRTPTKEWIFRIFYANHWNRPEIIFPLHLFGFTFKSASIFSSNAEKLRKINVWPNQNHLISNDLNHSEHRI